jgi:hypothetical protein
MSPPFKFRTSRPGQYGFVMRFERLRTPAIVLEKNSQHLTPFRLTQIILCQQMPGLVYGCRRVREAALIEFPSAGCRRQANTLKIDTIDYTFIT